jgi:hypothetical protein
MVKSCFGLAHTSSEFTGLEELDTRNVSIVKHISARKMLLILTTNCGTLMTSAVLLLGYYTFHSLHYEPRA